MRNWKIQNRLRINDERLMIKDLIKILLGNRGIETKKEIEEFLNPKLETITIKSVGIDKKQLKKAIARIGLAIKNKEQIVIFGDYDVDGICGTAILWETLNSLGAKVMPYIPHRIEEGYGLSVKGVNNVILNLFQDPKETKKKMLKRVQHDTKKGLIITVDNGIVANKAVDYANGQGIDVIITDHHTLGGKKPNAYAIIHTTKLCGAGVAYLLAKELKNCHSGLSRIDSGVLHTDALSPQNDGKKDFHLELVALATVADLVPLKGANRTLLKFGLEALKNTKRVGLLELFKEAGIDKAKIGVYEIGHIIAPRLNATGRLEYAMDSLRLICTNNQKRAEILAKEIGLTNRERQLLTINTAQHAIESVRNSTSLKLRGASKKELKKLLFVVHESYQQGVIGLVAGKLVEEFYRPAIVISKGKKYSKASARSIKGFNIIEFIRTTSEFLVDAGGHPMAAGFTIETEKIPSLEKFINSKIESLIDAKSLIRKLRIDCELSLSFVDVNLYESLQKMAPFGIGNPEPVFLSREIVINDIRLVGNEGKHLKLRLVTLGHSGLSRIDSGVANAPQNDDSRVIFDAIAFGMGERAGEFHIGDKVDVVYSLERDEWNGSERLQLKIKDFGKHAG